MKLNENEIKFYDEDMLKTMELNKDQTFSFWYKNIDFRITVFYFEEDDLEEITLSLDRVYLSNYLHHKDPKKDQENLNTVIEVSKKLWQSFPKNLIYMSGIYLEFGDAIVEKQNSKYVIKQLGWLNFFGKEKVEEIGREKLLSAPAYKVEELEDGAIVVLLSPTMYEDNSDHTLEKLVKHLGLKNVEF